MSASDGADPLSPDDLDARFSYRDIRSVDLLVNPASGGGRGAEIADRAAARLRGHGVEVRLLSGETVEESQELARRAVERGVAGEVDALAVCGGDGMISLAVQAQAHSGVPLGIIPAGTGNDLAREYGVPLKSTEAAADLLVAGRVERVDLGRVTPDGGEPQVFASIVCAGLDSAVNRRVNEMELLSGPLRYVLASAMEFARYRARRFTLTFDGDERVEEDILLSAYAITRTYGGNMRIAPDADRADGLLDVCYVENISKPRLAWAFPRIYSGTHVGRPGVVTRRCRTVRIEAADVEAFADGDAVAPLPVTVEVLPGAGLFLVP